MNLPVRIKFVKLVRDRVPEFYPELKVVYQATDPKEWGVLLKGKLVEEVIEYLTSNDPEELADILEVVFALARVQHQMMTRSELIQWMDGKAAHRGGYISMTGMYVEGKDHIDS